MSDVSQFGDKAAHQIAHQTRYKATLYELRVTKETGGVGDRGWEGRWVGGW